MVVADVVVVGGGVAGSAAAVELARAGRRIVLVERQNGPHHKVCGEFVSGEAHLYLRDLGIDSHALEPTDVTCFQLHVLGKSTRFHLPFPAFGISRRVLDEAILRRASEVGAALMRGRAVRQLRPCGRTWVTELEDGTQFASQHIFLATGKHDLRGWKRAPGPKGGLIAFKQHWKLRPSQNAALKSAVELFLFRGGYAGLMLVESGVANLCLVVDRERLNKNSNRWDLLLAELRSECPILSERMDGGTPCWERPLAMASIPYGWMKHGNDGLWRLGDQAAVIPSFAGDGVAIALHSARLASQHYMSGLSAEEFQTRLAEDLAKQVRLATTLSRFLLTSFGQAIASHLVGAVPYIVALVARQTRVAAAKVASARKPLASGQ